MGLTDRPPNSLEAPGSPDDQLLGFEARKNSEGAADRPLPVLRGERFKSESESHVGDHYDGRHGQE